MNLFTGSITVSIKTHHEHSDISSSLELVVCIIINMVCVQNYRYGFYSVQYIYQSPYGISDTPVCSDDTPFPSLRHRSGQMLPYAPPSLNPVLMRSEASGKRAFSIRTMLSTFTGIRSPYGVNYGVNYGVSDTPLIFVLLTS